MIARVVLVTALGLASASAPTTTRFRIEQKTESRIDLSGFGQGEQTQSQSSTWFVSLTYSDSAGGRVLHVVIDSVRVDPGPVPISQASIDSARGATFHGFLDADWRLRSLKASNKSLLVTQFDGTVRMLHPSLRAGAASGTKWVDTVDIATQSTQANLNSRTVRSFVMGGSEAFGGSTATRVAVETFTTIKGTLETPGGPADMDGEGPGTGAYYLGPDGRVVGSTSTAVVDAKVNMAAAPAPIPVKTTTTTTVSVLR